MSTEMNKQPFQIENIQRGGLWFIYISIEFDTFFLSKLTKIMRLKNPKHKFR